ncbi:MAG: hypothetical protein WHT45_12655 [Ignavibacterium sp.]
MQRNLLNIISDLLKQQLVFAIADESKNLDIVSKAAGVSKEKIMDILCGKSNKVTLEELSNLMKYCKFSITLFVLNIGEVSQNSFDFIIDEDFFSVN